MVLGPDGDPVPPAAFSAAAAEQPDARLALPDGTRVPAPRVTVVLQAQARGRLAEIEEGAEVWIRAMLGVAAPPEPAGPDELDAELAAPGAELTLFGKELLVGTPTGASFIIGPARADDAASELLAIQWLDGTRIGAQGLSARLRRGAAGPKRSGAPPGGGFGRRPELVSELPLPGCRLLLENEALTLSTPWGERFRFIPAAPDASDPPPVRICRSDGESITSRQLAEALDLVLRADASRPEDAGGTSGEPLLDDAVGGEPAEPAEQEPAPAEADPTAPLVPGPDGKLDLGWLAEAAVEVDGPLLKVTITGLPEGATLSAGIDNGGGSWTLTAQDLEDLSLFAPPAAAGAFEIDATFTTPVGDSRIGIPIRCAAAGSPELPARSAEPLDHILPPTTDLDGSWQAEPPQGPGDDDTMPPPPSALQPAVSQHGAPRTAEAVEPRMAGEEEQQQEPASSASAPELWVVGADRTEHCAPALPEEEEATGPADPIPDAENQACVMQGAESPFEQVAVAAGDDAGPGDEEESAAALPVPARLPHRDDMMQPDPAPCPRPEQDGSTTGSRMVPLGLGPLLTRLADGSAPAVILIGGVPQDARLSAGIDNRDGTWTLAPAQMTGLGVTLPGDRPKIVTLSATAIGIDRDGGMSAVSCELRVASDGSAQVTDGACGTSTREIALDLREVVRDIAGEEPARAIVIGGLPRGAELCAGTYDPQIASWIVRPDQLEGLRLIGPASGAAHLSLRITTVVKDRATGRSGARSRIVEVDVAPDHAGSRRARRVGGVGFWRPLAERRAERRSAGDL